MYMMHSSLKNSIFKLKVADVVGWNRTLEKGLGPSQEERLSWKIKITKNQHRRKDAALHF